MNDRQLGERLLLALRNSPDITADRLKHIVQDLLKRDDPRLEPLMQLIDRPEFLTLFELGQVNPQDQADTLLKSLDKQQQLEVGHRLRVVLQTIGEHPLQPSSHSAEDTTHIISDKEFQEYNRLLDHFAAPGQAPHNPGPQTIGPEPDKPNPPPPPPPPQPPRWIWWLIAVATTGLTVAIALTALRPNPICAKLGLCSVDWINDVWRDLDLADSTAKSLNQAESVQGYEQKLDYLRKQVQHIEQRGVFGAAQRERLDKLRTITIQAQARLRQERSDKQTVQDVTAEIPTLSGGLPGSQAAKKRQQLLERLNQVKPDSFSSAEVQSLRQQLQPPPLPLPPLPPPRRIGAPPVQNPAPESVPTEREHSPLQPPPPQRSSPPEAPSLFRSPYHRIILDQDAEDDNE